MRKISKNLLLVFIFFISINAIGQYVNATSIHHKKVPTGSFDLSYKNLVGSVYISDKLKPAYISLAKKKYPTKYDGYRDEMEISENNQFYYLPKTFDCIVNFENKTYIVSYFDFKNHFFVELVKGEKISLLLKEKIKLYHEKEGNGIVAYQPPTLKRLKDQLFIGYSDNTAEKLPKKKKDFYLLFSENSKEIQKFVKENRLNLKENNDLIEIFGYYNTIK